MRISLASLSLCTLISAVVLAVPSSRDDGHVAQTRKYDLEVTKGYDASDGITRMAYLVNGQTPGPEIRAREGDDLEISVKNASPVNFTIHFHGINQRGTPWSDGVPGVTQAMILPGEVFVYKWTATQSGVYWYHAHSRELYDDGIRGPIYLESSDSQPTPFGLISSDPQDITAMESADKNPQVLSLSDRKHVNSEKDIEEWQRTHVEQLCVDSLLINGRGRVICPPQETFAPYIGFATPTLTAKGCAFPNNPGVYPYSDGKPDLVDSDVFFTCRNTTAPFSVVSVDPGSKWASLAFVNMAGLWQIKVSIDSHKLYVYSADGQYHKPQPVDIITIPVGERFQAMIKLDQPVADYTIRIAADEAPQFISGFAVLSYTRPSSATVDSLPQDVHPAMAYGGLVLNNSTTLDAMTLQPFPETLAPPKESTHTFILDLNRTNSLTWTLGHNPYQPFLELITPLLLAPQDASKLDPSIVFSYPLGSVIDMVFQAQAIPPSHPIHKHGKKAWIIGVGTGAFTWDSVATAMKEQPSFFNLKNPPLRDGFVTPFPINNEPTFLVIRYIVTDPAVTFIHCHISGHLVGGMAAVLMEGVDKLPPIPPYYRNAGL